VIPLHCHRPVLYALQQGERQGDSSRFIRHPIQGFVS
jgi:hypothetical protein